ncbi:type ISP restriction/modification enzyme [Pseudomonadota bacterium]
MSFESITREYLRTLEKEIANAKATGEYTVEMSYKPFLDSYFRQLAHHINGEIETIFEPRKQAESGRPDWRFYNSVNLGVYGYVEGKGLNPKNHLSIDQHKQQIAKYLETGQRVILTDGLDFIFVSPDESDPLHISLIPKPVQTSDWAEQNIDITLEVRFKEFFETPSYRRVSEDELIADLAKRAKQLSISVQELSNLSAGAGFNAAENQAISALHELKSLLAEHHDASLKTTKTFADFVAQVLVFGLLFAHRVIREEDLSPSELYQKIQSFWSNTAYKGFTDKLQPFRALVQLLGEELESLGPIGTWYEDCRLLLAHIQLTEEQFEEPDYHSLFEKFLAVFDPETRFDYGAFYTPQYLAGYSVALVKAVVEKEMQLSNLYQEGNKLIDPCCGTGTFLEELIKNAGDDADKPTVIGFEILPAPYALAHHRISMLTDIYPKNISIILTNTLSDELERPHASEEENLIGAEQQKARELAQPPLVLIIGNPPSSDSILPYERQKSEIIQELIEDFRPPAEMRTGRQNIQKQLQNEFVKFLRWSCENLQDSNTGILSLILPSSFLQNPSYKFARKWLTQHFSKIWVLDIDQDARTGVRAESIFATLQGRMLLMGVIDSGDAELATVCYNDISQLSAAEKKDFLTTVRSSEQHLSVFQEISLSEDSFSFRPQQEFDRALYNRFWELCSTSENGDHFVFQRHCSGIKLAPSSMFVHADEAVLIRRCNDIADQSKSYSELKNRWYQGQQRPPSSGKFTQNVRSLFSSNLDRGNIEDYSYRPFLTTKAFISEPVLQELSGAGGGGTRYRPEVISAFSTENIIGIAIAPSTRDIGEKLHRFTSFCWHLPDNDLCRRGNAHVFCNQFPEYKKKREWNGNPINNINQVLLQALKAELGEVNGELVVYYVYAILCSSAYLDAFESALFSYAGNENWPRIPFVADSEAFRKIADFGERLAALEKNQSDEVDVEFHPFVKAFKNEFDLSAHTIDSSNERLVLKSGNNEKIVLQPVAREILDFEVSGYSVLQQWLKFYSKTYTRTTFNQNSYNKLLLLLSCIKRQIEIVRELDSEVTKIVNGSVRLI